MDAKVFTPEEINQRKLLGISRIREVVKSREWQPKAAIIFRITHGYDCTHEQAQALFQIGIANGFIEYGRKEDEYRITEA